jgi:hypothetical protein
VALIDDVKTALRLSASAYDDEISDLISAAQEALVMGGVSGEAATAATPAAPVKQAIILFCKANFGLDNPDSEKYERSFWLAIGRLVLSSEYQQPILTGASGSITAGDDELTVDDITGIEEDTWLSVAGAGAGGTLLVAKVTATDTSTLVVTLDRMAGTTVTEAAVRLL